MVGLFEGAPSENCLQLARRRAVLGCDGRACLAEAVRRAIWKARFIAAFSEPIPESLSRERLSKRSEKKGLAARARPPEFGLQFWKQRELKRDWGPALILRLSELKAPIDQMVRPKSNNVGDPLSRKE